MGFALVDDAIALLEKANADLEPELLSAERARELLATYARAEKLAAYGKTVLARRVDDAHVVARAAGTSRGRAQATMDAGTVLGDADQVRAAFRAGDISFDQAAEIAPAEQARPGSAPELLAAAGKDPFHVLKDRARKTVLEVQQHGDLFCRQHAARAARSHTDDLGMVHLHVAWEPHVGAPIVARAEAAAARRYREARTLGRAEPFARHLADAYAALLAGTATGRARRSEVVVLVSHEVTQRGWTDVRPGEHCKIPGLGPISPAAARETAADAFLTGVFYDGQDLRHLRRWTRHTPVEVAVALQLGDPPDFDGIRCADCGNRFGTENDHVEPHHAHGPASTDNLEPRCYRCHRAKTERDRRAGKLAPRGDAERAPPHD